MHLALLLAQDDAACQSRPQSDLSRMQDNAACLLKRQSNL